MQNQALALVKLHAIGEVQQEKVQSWEEKLHALVHVVCHPVGKQFDRNGHRSPDGHKLNMNQKFAFAAKKASSILDCIR